MQDRVAYMQAGASRDQRHEEIRARSYAVLERARRKRRGYDSVLTRLEMKGAVESMMGKVAYDWQLDVAECLVLGVNAIVVAGTGAGKTLPFVMPLLLREMRGKVVIIISPLISLQHDQERRFTEMGLKAKAINSETLKANLGLFKVRTVFPLPLHMLTYMNRIL